MPEDVVAVKNILMAQATTEKKKSWRQKRALNAKRTPCTHAVPGLQNVRCVFAESVVTCVAASDRAMADQCL